MQRIFLLPSPFLWFVLHLPGAAARATQTRFPHRLQCGCSREDAGQGKAPPGSTTLLCLYSS